MSDPVDGLDWLCWDPNEFGLLSADNNVIEGTFPSRVDRAEQALSASEATYP